MSEKGGADLRALGKVLRGHLGRTTEEPLPERWCELITRMRRMEQAAPTQNNKRQPKKPKREH